jgi:hypothetical protein
MECDNGHTLEVPIIGVSQLPCVRVLCVLDELGKEVWVCGKDNETAKVNFRIRNPGSKTTYTVKIQNDTLATLPFQWNVYDNPGFLQDHNIYPVEATESIQISPNHGSLTPNSAITFLISFSPKEIKEFDIFGDLVLLDDKNTVIHKLDTTLEKILNIQCLATTIAHSVRITPPIINIPVSLGPGEVHIKNLCIQNNSFDTVNFSWHTTAINPQKLIFKTTKPTGSLAANESMEIEFLIETYEPTTCTGALICSFAHYVEVCVPVYIHVEMKSKMLGVDSIDFGLMALGEYVVRSVPLQNRTPLDLRFRLNTLDLDERKKIGFEECDVGEMDYMLDVWPMEGIVTRGGFVMLEITYVPLWHQKLHALLECHVVEILRDELVEGDTIKTVPALDEWKGVVELQNCQRVSLAEISADVQTKIAKIVYPSIAMSCFVGVPVVLVTQLQNKTKLPTKFRWENIENEYICADFSPAEGELYSKEILEIRLTLVCNCGREMQRLRFECKIEGMIENLGVLEFLVDVFVCGLKVRFEMEKSEESVYITNERNSVIKVSKDAKKDSTKETANIITPMLLFPNVSVPSGRMDDENLSGSPDDPKKSSRSIFMIENIRSTQENVFQPKISESISEINLDPDSALRESTPTPSPSTTPRISLKPHSSNIKEIKIQTPPISPEPPNFVDVGPTHSWGSLYWPISTDSQPLSFDFGHDCPIYSTRTRRLIITNHTAIPTPFRMWVENFPATTLPVNTLKPVTPTPEKLLHLSKTLKPRVGFESPAGIAYIKRVTETRIQIQQMQTLLQEGRGAAFHATPNSGEIAPFGKISVDVAAFNNLVGVYRDNLVVEIGSPRIDGGGKHCLRKTLPIYLSVRGRPVKFAGSQLVKGSKVDRVNFGTKMVVGKKEEEEHSLNEKDDLESLSTF